MTEARKSDLVDIDVRIHAESQKAVLISDDGNRDNAVWLPLLHCEIERKDKGYAVVTLPEWLAIEKGLV